MIRKSLGKKTQISKKSKSQKTHNKGEINDTKSNDMPSMEERKRAEAAAEMERATNSQFGIINQILKNNNLCNNIERTNNNPGPVQKVCELIEKKNCKPSKPKRPAPAPPPVCNIDGKQSVNINKCIAEGYKVEKFDNNTKEYNEVTLEDNNIPKNQLTYLNEITGNNGILYKYYKSGNDTYVVSRKEDITNLSNQGTNSSIAGGRVKTKNTKKRKSKNSTNTRKSKNTSSSSKRKNKLTKYKRNNNRRTNKKGTSRK